MIKKWKAYCPLMKGNCVNGHVKSMGEDQDGEPIRCAFFITLKGKDPQSNAEYDDPGCSFHWMPILQVETNQMMRFNVASTDKTATEIRKHHASFIGALPEGMRNNLLQSNPTMIENGKKEKNHETV